MYNLTLALKVLRTRPKVLHVSFPKNCIMMVKITAGKIFMIRGVRRNFKKGFPLHLSDCCIRVVYIT